MTRKNLVTDAEIEEARTKIAEGFALLGLLSGGTPVCPNCGTNKKGKVKLGTRHYKCYRCSEWGSIINLLREKGGYSFVDAVNALLGKPTETGQTIEIDVSKVVIHKPFQAKLDTEVYAAVLASNFVSLEKAQKFYARWHIDPHFVEANQGRYLVDYQSFVNEMVDQFGTDRLVEAGLAKHEEDIEGKLYPFRFFGLKSTYPVIEPQITPNGFVTSMQFRPSHRQKEKVIAHKHGNGRYVPPFMSLAGAMPGKHLVGCGLEVIAKLEKPRLIYVVEGYKDMLAAQTMGAASYAIPGASAIVPDKVCEFFKKGGHTMLIALDGDKAGTEGQEALKEKFDAHKLPWKIKNLPDGKDVTDILVKRHKDNNCQCRTCQAS